MAKREYWIWLSAQTALRATAKAALLQRFGSPEAIYRAPLEELMRVPGVSRGEAERLENREPVCAERILEQCLEQDIQILTQEDSAYPLRLRHIFAPPPVLYVKGRLPAVDGEAVIAVIGTRAYSPYGEKMAQKLAAGIVRCGGLVCTGLNGGLDAVAAGAALKAGGCIGVLGTPHEAAHDALSEGLAAEGTLLSEYPPGTPWRRGQLRERNRITAGLSVGVAVVEAPEKSGTLLFVNEALDQGKEIFAVPGNADSPGSAGIIPLLQHGAKPVTAAWDILGEFDARFPGKLRRVETPYEAVSKPVEAAKPPAEAVSKPVERTPRGKKAIDKGADTGYIDLQDRRRALKPEQQELLRAIENGAALVDDMIEATGFSASKVLSQLTVLEVLRFVRREPGKRFVLNTTAK